MSRVLIYDSQTLPTYQRDHVCLHINASCLHLRFAHSVEVLEQRLQIFGFFRDRIAHVAETEVFAGAVGVQPRSDDPSTFFHRRNHVPDALPQKRRMWEFDGPLWVVFVCVYVCAYVCMCVCMYVYTYICTYVHMYEYLYMYIHIYVNTYTYIYVYISMVYVYTHIYTYITKKHCPGIGEKWRGGQIKTCDPTSRVQIYIYIYIYTTLPLG